MFITVHSFYESVNTLLNRDDTGAPKTCVVGNTLRTRISSQCQKRVLKDPESFSDELYEIFGLSIRSKFFPELLIKDLVEKGHDNKIVESLVRDFFKEKTKDEDKKEKNKNTEKNEKEIFENEKKREIIVLSKGEYDEILSRLEYSLKTNSKLDKNFKEIIKDIKTNISLDILMSGRMIAGDFNSRIQGALYLSHAYSINEHNEYSDYFTAIDDYEKNGSGYLGRKSLTSSIYLRQFTIDVNQLFKNICFGKKLDEENENIKKFSKLIIRDTIKALLLKPFGAMLTSTAPFGQTTFIMIEFSKNQPVHYSPWITEVYEYDYDYIEKFINHVDNFYKIYGIKDRFDTRSDGSLEEILDKVLEKI